jgi:hypothetical protein
MMDSLMQDVLEVGALALQRLEAAVQLRVVLVQVLQPIQFRPLTHIAHCNLNMIIIKLMPVN